MNDLNQKIIDIIKKAVKENDDSHGYREPIVGFTTADDPGFLDIRREINPDHYLPEDMLPGAKSVVSFFVPVSEVTALNNLHNGPSYDYAHVKWAQKGLMQNVIEALRTELLKDGIHCSKNTEGVIPFTLTPPYHPWLQKPIAVMCGVGKFGINRQIITKSGCAGRLGSVVIDAETTPTGRIEEEYCLYLVDGSCGVCVKNCPVHALSYNMIDRPKCKEQIHMIHSDYTGADKIVDSCAQCVAVPCATHIPKKEDLI